MYKLCKTEQSVQRQRQLEEALLETLLVQRFEDISISDFCDHLGIPRKSFYRYFSSKDGAIHALVDHRLMDCDLQYGGEGDRNATMGQLTWFFEYWFRQKKLLDALYRSGLSGMLADRALVLLENGTFFEFESRKQPKGFQQVADTFLVCGLLSLVIQWHIRGFRTSPQEMAEMTKVLLTRPLVEP